MEMAAQGIIERADYDETSALAGHSPALAR
jgi:hypothetical protein